jgi:sarcosine oxidase, subunit gamma
MIQTGNVAMVEHAIRRGPLDDYCSAFGALSTAGLHIAVVPQPAQINLRGQPSDLAAAVAEACDGVMLAPEVNDAVTNGAWHCLGLGPDEWLLVGPTDTGPEIAARLTGKLSAHHASVVDVSSNRVALDISGPRALALFASLTSFDMATLTPGRCAQTMLAKGQVIMQSGTDPETVRVFVRTSFARYLADVIVDAAPFISAS